MALKDVFDINFSGSKSDRVCSLTLRVFGLDIDLALYGFINDWVFPVLFVPSMRGFFTQSLFLGIFIGRLKEGANE